MSKPVRKLLLWFTQKTVVLQLQFESLRWKEAINVRIYSGGEPRETVLHWDMDYEGKKEITMTPRIFL